jgi:hypothetical protein
MTLLDLWHRLCFSPILSNVFYRSLFRGRSTEDSSESAFRQGRRNRLLECPTGEGNTALFAGMFSQLSCSLSWA